MARHFTLAEARQLLPRVEDLLRQAVDTRLEYQSADGELSGFVQQLSLAGGTRVDPGAAVKLRSRRDAAANLLSSYIESVQELGCQIKDLEVGLVDFPTYYRGTEVLLCWKLGEPGIEYWHGLEEGFRGRKTIDADFLDHHTGDKPH